MMNCDVSDTSLRKRWTVTGKWISQYAKRKPKEPRSTEESILLSIPQDWAAPLTVIFVSFTCFTVCWFLIAKRPTSERLLIKHRLRHARSDPDRFYDPRSGQSHRIFKSELATRALSSVHAIICCAGASRALHLDKVMLIFNQTLVSIKVIHLYSNRSIRDAGSF